MPHRILYRIRAIADADLPTVRDDETGAARAATRQELMDLGLFPHDGGYYSCAEQFRRASGVRDYAPHGLAVPGLVIAEGTPEQRAAMLPEEARAHVLHARVFRAVDPSQNARQLCAAHGPCAATDDAALLTAAQSLAATPDAPITHVAVPMGQLAPDSDVIVAENVLPHHWHGERRSLR
jgi:hypothetical protein